MPHKDVDSNSNNRKRKEKFNDNPTANYETNRSFDIRDNQSHRQNQKENMSLPHMTTTKIVEQSYADPVSIFLLIMP